MSTGLNYRPDIDGLRAVAVLGVLFFHAGLGFPGGYIGVDVFFVISGFLITSLLMKDLRAGTFSILDFWERRIRRIVPALVVVVLVVVTAGWFILLPSDYETLGKQILSLIACASNVKFWMESGYFDTAAEEKPLLHTWSLSVEEQFYLVIPLILALFFKLRKSSWILPLLLVGIVGSFALSVYGSYRHPSAAFYLLPFRAWELGVGSLLAFAPAITSSRLRHGAAWVGLAAILVPYFAYAPGIRFPGLSAFPPVAGAALIIWSGLGGREKTLPGRVLAAKPLVWIGLLSYSLYLWHWPFFAFQRYLGYSHDIPWVQLSLAASSFILAWLSLRFIERPFRSRKLLRSRSAVFGMAAGIFATLILTSVALWKTDGAKMRLQPSELRLAEGQSDFSYINELTIDDIPNGMVPIGENGDRPTVYVWGDSHAMAILPAIDAACKEVGRSGRAITHSATAPVLDWHFKSGYGLGIGAPMFNRKVMDHLVHKTHPSRKAHVILVARWDEYFEADQEGANFETALENTIRELAKNEELTVTVLLEVPSFPFNPPRSLTISALSGTSNSHHYVKLEDYRKHIRPQLEFFKRLKPLGIKIVDPAQSFTNAADRIYPMDDGGLLWRDDDHLTTYGSMRLKPIFETILGVSLPKIEMGTTPDDSNLIKSQ